MISGVRVLQICVKKAFSQLMAPHFHSQLLYLSIEDGNEIMANLTLKLSAFTHRTIIHIHTYSVFLPNVLCMSALSLAISSPRSLSFTQINRPTHKHNELLMIH